jgi:SRSO17 transposase
MLGRWRTAIVGKEPRHVDPTLFAAVGGELAAFHRRFAPRFGRPEARRRSEQYLRGLLVQQTDRRNAENLAEVIPDATPRALQRLLTEAPWNAATVTDELQAYLAEHLTTPHGVFILDETGFPKQGTKSVGVARQYCGTLGKVGNCQVGVFLAYASERGQALVDGRLYLPATWTADAARCAAAGVPAEVTYQTKPELGLALLRQARAAGHLVGRWVTADEQYGQAPSFRDALDAAGWWYVLEVPAPTPVFLTEPAAAVPPWSGRGRPPTRPRLVADAAPAQPAAAVAAAAADRWQDLTVALGEQGPRTYQFAAWRVWESRQGLPGRACWLVARRNLDGTEPKYYLANAPADTALRVLAEVGAQRWAIETLFQQAKGEAGLDEYEVRGWVGWQHHVALVLLAGAFLLHLQQGWGKKPAAVDRAPTEPGAARAAAPAPLGLGRVVALAPRYAGAQRPRDPRPYPPPPRPRP